MKTKSEFRTWFERQYGKRDATGGTDLDLLLEIERAEVARKRLKDRQEWDRNLDVALMAWMAREKQ